ARKAITSASRLESGSICVWSLGRNELRARLGSHLSPRDQFAFGARLYYKKTRTRPLPKGEGNTMATGSLPATNLPPAPPLPGDSRGREFVIGGQLGRTSLYVRLVDLASGVAVWLIGVLLVLMSAALFDHFIGLGVFGRCLALAALAGGSLWYVTM